MQLHDSFRKFAARVADQVGNARTFIAALLVIAVWAATGPIFHFSDTWQLFINTGTTVVTFLMVFLIQNTQNRDARAIHLKLDELIRAQKSARNIFADLEDATDAELRELHEEFRRLRARGLAKTRAAADRTLGANGNGKSRGH